jgi:hypothetical protein
VTIESTTIVTDQAQRDDGTQPEYDPLFEVTNPQACERYMPLEDCRQDPPCATCTAGEEELHHEARAKAMHDLAAVPLGAISTEPPPPLLLDRLDPIGHTIVYGTGGIGKGTLASKWIGELVQDDDARVLIVDYELHPEEWARRIEGLGYWDLKDRIIWTAPNGTDAKVTQGALWDHTAALKALVEQAGITYMVIDSVIQACMGADVTEQDAPTRYAAALQKIGVPTLSLGHVRRDGDTEYPFGSVGWHNNARLTWSLNRNGSDTILTNRKHNNYEGQQRYAVTVIWLDGKPREIAERPYQAVLADRIYDVLSGPMSPEAITNRLNDLLDDEDAPPIKVDSVRKALRRGAKAGKDHPPAFDKAGAAWQRWAPPESPRILEQPAQLALVEEPA